MWRSRGKQPSDYALSGVFLCVIIVDLLLIAAFVSSG
jgi:hypothetical protein